MDPTKIKILAVYKSLEQVVIFEDEKGEVCIRAFAEDQGTEQEQAAIRDLVLSSGFKVNNTQKIS